MKDMKSKLYCWETPWRHLSFFVFLSTIFLGKNWHVFSGSTKTHLSPQSHQSYPTSAACRQVAATIPFNLALLCSKKMLKIHQKNRHGKNVVFKSSVLEKEEFLSQRLCVLLFACFLYAILDTGFESCSPDKDLGPPATLRCWMPHQKDRQMFVEPWRPLHLTTNHWKLGISLSPIQMVNWLQVFSNYLNRSCRCAYIDGQIPARIAVHSQVFVQICGDLTLLTCFSVTWHFRIYVTAFT